MKILQIVHQYKPQHVGGVELYTESLTHHLCRSGHEVAVFTRRNHRNKGIRQETDTSDTAEPIIFGVWHGNLDPGKRFVATFGDVALERYFTTVLDQFAPQIVHIQHLMGLPASLPSILIKKQIPYVITLHDFWWRCANANLLTNYSMELCSGPRAYVNCARCVASRPTERSQRILLASISPIVVGGLGFRNHILARVLTRANRIIAPSAFVRNWYSSQGIPKERIEVIPLGIDVPKSQVARQHEQSHQEKEPPPLRFLYVGGLAEIKGVHVIVDAFSRLGADQSAELWIAGDLTVDPEYVVRLRSHSDMRIRFLGRLTKDEVWKTMATCHILLVPSLCFETFGFTAREALQADLPVFASQLGALTEAVIHGRNGWLLPPGDVDSWYSAMQRIIECPHLLHELRPSGHSTRPEFWSPAAHTKRMMSVYDQVIEPGGHN